MMEPNSSTTKLPWTPDYEISSEQVGYIVEQNTPLKVTTASYLSEGWDFYTYLVNEEWVFRLPKRTEEADTLNRERLLLEKLNIPVRFPTFEIWVPKPAGFHLPIAAYRYIKGASLSELEPSDVDLRKLAHDLGDCLKRLHDVQITKPRASRDPLKNWFADIEEVLATCRPHLSTSVMNVCEQMVNDYELREFSDSMVSCHCDLGPEHILVDENHELAAIIDWADMGTAPRFVDFAGSWMWGGEDFFHAISQTYGIAPREHESQMVRTLGVLLALSAIDFGHLENDQEAIDYGVHTIVRRVEEDLM